MAETVSNKLRVRLVSLEGTLFDHPADAAELPSKNGYMEVLYGRAPLLAELGPGEVTVHGALGEGVEPTSHYSVRWGFVEVLPDRVTILV